jgi:hypothetical protein
MGVISGVGGFVNLSTTAAKRVANWTIDKTADLQAKYASNTEEAPIQVAGNYDWTGSYEAFGPIPEVKPGDLFQFRGIFEGTNNKGVYSAASETICDRVEIVWDQEGGSLIRHTVGFSGNGALSAGEVSAPDVDDETPEAHSSSGCLVTLANPAAVPNPSELLNVRGVRLAISRDNKLYHSSTSGQVPKRVMGNLSAELSIDLYIDDPTEVEGLINSAKYVHIGVDDSNPPDPYWQIYGVMFNSVTGIGVPRETADLIAVTITGAFSGWNDIDSVLTQGNITDPTDTPVVWWP